MGHPGLQAPPPPPSPPYGTSAAQRSPAAACWRQDRTPPVYSPDGTVLLCEPGMLPAGDAGGRLSQLAVESGTGPPRPGRDSSPRPAQSRGLPPRPAPGPPADASQGTRLPLITPGRLFIDHHLPSGAAGMGAVSRQAVKSVIIVRHPDLHLLFSSPAAHLDWGREKWTY